jgi:uncharacterized protein
MLTVVLLICSNAFMTIAWYGHLKFRTAPLIVAILASWLIALAEYALQVPANRFGYADPAEQTSEATPATGITEPSGWQQVWRAKFSAPQLKILQEVITISVFVVFNFLWLKNSIRLTDWIAFALILLAVVVMMAPRIIGGKAETEAARSSHSLLPEDVAMEPVDGSEMRESRS